MDQVDWREDSWFSQHHANDLTEKFKAWWLEFYGTPDAYHNDPEERHEYWVRCAFAWHGWQAKSEPEDSQ